MWMLNNRTPFAAERCWVRDKNGAEVWLVAIKATFDIMADGALRLAESQQPVNIAPKFRNTGTQPSLLHDTDFPHLKAATDVLIEGHAHAPRQKPVTRLSVGLRVANINKILGVSGDRVWKSSGFGLSMSKPEPFSTMPLNYERAYGGVQCSEPDKVLDAWEPRNPAGTGFATRPTNLVGRPLPNVEYTTSLINSWRDRPVPAGFGPIAGHWSPRRELAGTYDEAWQASRSPLLPEDFDERYYNCVPADQQVPGYLKGGELVEVANMTPSGYLRFNLPRLVFSARTRFSDGTTADHLPQLYTVTIQPDWPRVVLVWNLHHQCHHKVLKLIDTTIQLKTRIHSVDDPAAVAIYQS